MSPAWAETSSIDRLMADEGGRAARHAGWGWPTGGRTPLVLRARALGRRLHRRDERHAALRQRQAEAAAAAGARAPCRGRGGRPPLPLERAFPLGEPEASLGGKG